MENGGASEPDVPRRSGVLMDDAPHRTTRPPEHLGGLAFGDRARPASQMSEMREPRPEIGRRHFAPSVPEAISASRSLALPTSDQTASSLPRRTVRFTPPYTKPSSRMSHRSDPTGTRLNSSPQRAPRLPSSA